MLGHTYQTEIAVRKLNEVIRIQKATYSSPESEIHVKMTKINSMILSELVAAAFEDHKI
jgi:hypothetical protein